MVLIIKNYKMGMDSTKDRRWKDSFSVKFLSSIYLSVHKLTTPFLLTTIIGPLGLISLLDGFSWIISVLLLYFEYRRRLNHTWIGLKGFWLITLMCDIYLIFTYVSDNKHYNGDILNVLHKSVSCFFEIVLFIFSFNYNFNSRKLSKSQFLEITKEDGTLAKVDNSDLVISRIEINEIKNRKINLSQDKEQTLKTKDVLFNIKVVFFINSSFNSGIESRGNSNIEVSINNNIKTKDSNRNIDNYIEANNTVGDNKNDFSNVDSFANYDTISNSKITSCYRISNLSNAESRSNNNYNNNFNPNTNSNDEEVNIDTSNYYEVICKKNLKQILEFNNKIISTYEEQNKQSTNQAIPELSNSNNNNANPNPLLILLSELTNNYQKTTQLYLENRNNSKTRNSKTSSNINNLTNNITSFNVNSLLNNINNNTYSQKEFSFPNLSLSKNKVKELFDLNSLREIYFNFSKDVFFKKKFSEFISIRKNSRLIRQKNLYVSSNSDLKNNNNNCNNTITNSNAYVHPYSSFNKNDLQSLNTIINNECEFFFNGGVINDYWRMMMLLSKIMVNTKLICFKINELNTSNSNVCFTITMEKRVIMDSFNIKDLGYLLISLKGRRVDELKMFLDEFYSSKNTKNPSNSNNKRNTACYSTISINKLIGNLENTITKLLNDGYYLSQKQLLLFFSVNKLIEIQPNNYGINIIEYLLPLYFSLIKKSSISVLPNSLNLEILKENNYRNFIFLLEFNQSELIEIIENKDTQVIVSFKLTALRKKSSSVVFWDISVSLEYFIYVFSNIVELIVGYSNCLSSVYEEYYNYDAINDINNKNKHRNSKDKNKDALESKQESLIISNTTTDNKHGRSLSMLNKNYFGNNLVNNNSNNSNNYGFIVKNDQGSGSTINLNTENNDLRNSLKLNNNNSIENKITKNNSIYSSLSLLPNSSINNNNNKFIAQSQLILKEQLVSTLIPLIETLNSLINDYKFNENNNNNSNNIESKLKNITKSLNIILNKDSSLLFNLELRELLKLNNLNIMNYSYSGSNINLEVNKISSYSISSVNKDKLISKINNKEYFSQDSCVKLTKSFINKEKFDSIVEKQHSSRNISSYFNSSRDINNEDGVGGDIRKQNNILSRASSNNIANDVSNSGQRNKLNSVYSVNSNLRSKSSYKDSLIDGSLKYSNQTHNSIIQSLLK